MEFKDLHVNVKTLIVTQRTGSNDADADQDDDDGVEFRVTESSLNPLTWLHDYNPSSNKTNTVQTICWRCYDLPTRVS